MCKDNGSIQEKRKQLSAVNSSGERELGEGKIQEETLAIGPKTSEADKKEAGARQKRKS